LGFLRQVSIDTAFSAVDIQGGKITNMHGFGARLPC
jgi:hypothetical protein